MIAVKKYEVKPNGLRFILDIELTDYVNDLWLEAYKESFLKKGCVTLRSSGAPTVDRINFYGNHAETKDFSEYAKCELKEFCKEFEERLVLANAIFDSKLCLIKQQEEYEKQLEFAKNKELEELNKKLNNK